MGSSHSARQSDRPHTVHHTKRRAHDVTARVHQKITEDSAGRSHARPPAAPRIAGAGLNPVHLGSDFEDFLKEEGLFEEVQVLAVKELLTYRIQELMRQKRLTKDALAKRMKTSRAQLDRLLDPENPSVTLATLGKAACALGRTLRVELADGPR